MEQYSAINPQLDNHEYGAINPQSVNHESLLPNAIPPLGYIRLSITLSIHMNSCWSSAQRGTLAIH